METQLIQRLWTVRETAERTGYSQWFIYREVAEGRLPRTSWPPP